jgi:ribosomal protein L21E
MSILRSYIDKNNTIVSNSYVNTGRNPVIELNFGASDLVVPNFGYSRLLFNLDLSLLEQNIATGVISTGCTTGMTHTLKMTNTSSFDNELLNTEMSNQRKRATSFDLILFRIPNVSGTTGNPQEWDEGVGYDYSDFNLAKNSAQGGMSPLTYVDSRAFSTRPSNWYQTSTINNWSQPGVYSNTNNGTVNYSGLTIVARQHFELGNEDINMDMSNEINGILNGSITGVTGWGVAYVPQIENITGLTDSYSVAFFSRHTQTFYQPYLLTNYNDLIQDDRNQFLKNQTNKLYLYIYQNGDFVNLDNNPTVTIKGRDGQPWSGATGLTTCLVTKGVYEVTVPNVFTSCASPCVFYDVWSNLSINGQSVPNVENQFILQEYTAGVQIGSTSKEPQKFGFDFYGILQNEQILNSDIRKVGVTIKKAYTAQQMLLDVSAFYRVYVKEGTTEVQVQDWTPLNRTPNEYYFMFDMRDKIPNQYYVDIQVNTSGEKDTYKKQLTFNIVNRK